MVDLLIPGPEGKIEAKYSHNKDDESPIDCDNKYVISQNYTRAYLHHLFRTNEILGYRLATQHNLSFYNNLLSEAKDAILNNTFNTWSKDFLNCYN